MSKKYRGSVLIWFICILMLISALVMINLEKSYRKNQSLQLELNGFKIEQNIYTNFLYYFEEHKDLMLKEIFRKNNGSEIDIISKLLDSRPTVYNDKNFIIEKVSVRDSEVFFSVMYKSQGANIRSSFLIETVDKTFKECTDKVIDNRSKNEFQNDKNRLVNQALENCQPVQKEEGMNIIELDSGDNYITIENSVITVENNNEIVLKTPITFATYIIGPNPNTNIYFESVADKTFDRLYIFNNGDVHSDGLWFNGLLCIKSGNLYTNRIKGMGRVIIDGFLLPINVDKVDTNLFEIVNKYSLINKELVDIRIVNYKR